MEERILLDTNILIAAFRREKSAVDFLIKMQFRYVVSDITIMELLAGCTTISKRNEMENVIETYDRALINQEVIAKAVSLIKRYAVRHKNIHLPDLLIAATAYHYKLPLKSLNRKDFQFYKEIQLLD